MGIYGNPTDNRSISTDDGFYTGDLDSNNNPDGYGTFYWNNGDSYEGYWQKGKRHGKGKMTFSDGTTQDGDWQNDLFVGESGYSTVSTSSNGGEDEGNHDTIKMDYNDGAYTGQTNGDGLPHGRGKLELPFLSATYDGEFINGEMTGRGTMTWESGAVYNGYFKNGLRHGYGQMTFSDKTKRFGTWENDLFSSESDAPADFIEDLDEALSSASNDEIEEEDIIEEQFDEEDEVVTISYNGGTYTGTVKNGLPHGKGTLRLDEYECTYEGDFVDGTPEGFGKKSWDNGDCCEGTIANGVFCGNGWFFFADGDSYEGEFKDDAFNGFGKFTSANGDIYEGDFEDDSFNGKGVFTWSNGNTYDGGWKNDAWSGSGTFTRTEGDTKVSYFSSCWNGIGCAEVVLRDANGNESDGSMSNFKFTPEKPSDRYEGEKNFKGIPHGKGKMYYSDGSIYEGGWAYGKWYREGTYTDPEGNVYKGSFLSTKQSLNITLIKDGRAISGTMKDGVFHAN